MVRYVCDLCVDVNSLFPISLGLSGPLSMQSAVLASGRCGLNNVRCPYILVKAFRPQRSILIPPTPSTAVSRIRGDWLKVTVRGCHGNEEEEMKEFEKP